jgi:syndecan 1
VAIAVSSKDAHRSATADVLAIVSVGCHPSSGVAAAALRCEASGASFATGFADADRVGYLYQDAYYPLDQVRCCWSHTARNAHQQ